MGLEQLPWRIFNRDYSGEKTEENKKEVYWKQQSVEKQGTPWGYSRGSSGKDSKPWLKAIPEGVL